MLKTLISEPVDDRTHLIAHRIFDQDACSQTSVLGKIQMRILIGQGIEQLFFVFGYLYALILKNKMIAAYHGLFVIDLRSYPVSHYILDRSVQFLVEQAF